MLLTAIFVLIVVVLLPLAAFASSRQGSDPAVSEAALDLQAQHRQALIVHLLLLGLAFGTAWIQGLAVIWIAPLQPGALLLAVGTVLVFLTVAQLEARRTTDNPLRRAFRQQPLDWLSVLVSVSAAVSEEVVYRWVLVLVLQVYLPWWPAVLISAAAFACGHLAQGWRGAALSAAFALAMQWLLLLSGALWLPILCHLGYDLAAALLARRRAR